MSHEVSFHLPIFQTKSLTGKHNIAYIEKKWGKPIISLVKSYDYQPRNNFGDATLSQAEERKILRDEHLREFK